MSRRRRRRRSRRKGKGKGNMDALQGLSPKAMQKALGQIDTDEIDDVEEVIVRTKDEEIVLKNPEVSVMNMGQEVWSVVPQSTERRARTSSTSGDEPQQEPKKIKIKEDDVNLIVNQANVSKEEAIAAIKANDGDIAAALMSLK